MFFDFKTEDFDDEEKFFQIHANEVSLGSIVLRAIFLKSVLNELCIFEGSRFLSLNNICSNVEPYLYGTLAMLVVKLIHSFKLHGLS